MAKSAQPRYLNGGALRRKRLEAGLEQAQLAEMVGAKQNQVSQWERGDNGCRLGMLHKLAGALDAALKALGQPGCTVTDLMRADARESNDSEEEDEAAAKPAA